MNVKKISLSASILILVGALTSGGMVKADDDNDHDDDHEYYEKYEKFRDDKYKYDDDDKYKYEYEDDDDDEYEYKYDDDNEYDNYTNLTASQQDTWNIWTRTIMVQKGELPFSESKNVTLKLENETIELSFYAVPRDGEIFVPGKAVAEVLGAKGTVYNTSQILEVTANNTEIISRANTNVAYVNKLKTPIPSVAFYLNNDIYIPISVITNALGYSVEWQEENNSFICRNLSVN